MEMTRRTSEIAGTVAANFAALNLGRGMKRGRPLAAAAFVAMIAGPAARALRDTVEEATCEMTIRFESPLDWRCSHDTEDCTVCVNRSDHPSTIWLQCEGDSAAPERRRNPAGAELSVCSGRNRQGT